MRKTKGFTSGLSLIFKGMAMGAADVIPGVSGGTIAFITGIYEKLIYSLSQIDLSVYKTWKKNGLPGVWSKINGSFLLRIFSGIFISIISLAKLITWLMDNHPIPLWSFFFGLIAASVWFILKQIKHKSPVIFLAFITT
jgi:putative membrane protein